MLGSLGPLEPGTPAELGRYRLLATLGSGGMGTVHLAQLASWTSPSPDSLVALKTLRQDLAADREFRIRFRREAEAARTIRSPHTAQLIDADPDAATPWLATEYVIGPSLHDAVAADGPLPLPVVRAMGADLARGLAAVHGARILHRDLKPGNVLLAADGPKVIDFGIAQAYDATALTATGVMVGSPGFMSPEHLDGGEAVTTASDVFCLGALLCFAVTGHGPFGEGELAAVVHRLAQGQHDLSVVPEPLRDTLVGCLDGDPDARPTTGALIRALDDDAAAARPGAPPVRRSGRFPWPEGVLAALGSHEASARRAVADAQATRHEKSVHPEQGVHPEQAVLPEQVVPSPPPADSPGGTPPDGRRRRALVALTATAAVLVVGALTAVLLPQLTDDPGGGPGSGPGGDPSPSAPATGDSRVITTDMVDLGKRAYAEQHRPEGWSPWQADVDGVPTACSLTGSLLVCGFSNGVNGGFVQARDTADGELVWEYPERAGAKALAPRPAVSGARAYVPEKDGIAVLRLKDGRILDQWAGAPGYRTTKAVAGDGVVYVSYEGAAGVGNATNMLFRAYRQKDGTKLWEQTLPLMYPQSLILAGGWVHLDSPSSTVGLDPETGEVAERRETACDPGFVHEDTLVCPDGVLNARTLDRFPRAPSGDVLALGEQGVALVGSRDESLARGVDLRSGRTLWTTGLVLPGKLLLLGDRFVDISRYGVETFSVTTGKSLAVSRPSPGWPKDEDGSQGSGADVTDVPREVLVEGGVLFLLFDDGTVLSRSLP